MRKTLKAVVFYRERVPELEGEYFEALKDAGVCPTCGQNVEGLSEADLILL